MQIIEGKEEIKQLIKRIRTEGKIIGFVPTMGYLHEGHLSLVEKAREDCCFTVVSIFVNPLQFGPSEDFQRYPRDIDRDVAMLKKASVDVLFVPSTEEMYKDPHLTRVNVSNLSEKT